MSDILISWRKHAFSFSTSHACLKKWKTFTGAKIARAPAQDPA